VDGDFKLFPTYHVSAIPGKNKTRNAREALIPIDPFLSFRVTGAGAGLSLTFALVR